MKTNIHVAYRIITLQAIVVLIVSFLSLAIQDVKIAYSILLGGVICILPNLYFARHFLYSAARSPKQMLSTFFRAEVIKLLLSALLFGLTIYWIPISIVSLFIGYLLAQISQWVTPLLSSLGKRQVAS